MGSPPTAPRSHRRLAPGGPFWRWLVFIAVPASSWPLVAWLHSAVPGQGTFRLTEALFVAGRSAIPPSAGAPRELRSLPDDWRRHRRGALEGWYELPFRVDGAVAERWAVFLPALSMNAAVYLNGRPVGDGGRLEPPVTRNWAHPLLLPFPGAFLVPGDNVIHVRLVADVVDSGLLGPVSIGPHRLLAGAHAWRYALKITAVWVITLCLIMVGVFTAVLWARWREEPSYGWFAAALFVWAAMHLNVLVVDPPVGTAAWYGLWYASLGGWASLLIRFLLSFLGDPQPRAGRAILAIGAIGAATTFVLAAADSPLLHGFARVWLTTALVASAVSTYWVVRTLRDVGNDWTAVFPHLVGSSVVGCALHDWFVFCGLYGATYDYYLPYTAPLVLIGMGWALLHRFVGALRDSEAAVANLERRVEEKRLELAQAHERLREIERSRVVSEERERIMREMHDGLGAHLVSTLSLIEGGRGEAVADALRAALEDLRVMVDSLEPLEGDLVTAFAMLRARMQSRLEAAGVRVEWRVEDLPQIPDLGPATVMQVLRILQEAIANVLKHAGARAITVRSGAGGNRGGAPGIFVEVSDDGRGIREGAPRGRGLQHMKRRASEVGAELDIHGSSSGTTVRLWMPIDVRVEA